MNPAQDIQSELTAIGGALLAAMPRTMPYHVPEGYFAGLAAGVHAALPYETDPVPAFPTALPYAVPEGYFDTFPGRMMALLKAGDPAAIPPAATPYAAPSGYFENLPGQIMARIRTEAQTAAPAPKIIPLRRFSAWRNVRLAAAAVLLAVAGIGLYRLTMPRQENITQQLAAIPKDSIRDYLLQHVDDFEADELASLAAPAITGGNARSSIQLPVGREDIIQYLDETGWDTRVY